jgi:hypothetical protein
MVKLTEIRGMISDMSHNQHLHVCLSRIVETLLPKDVFSFAEFTKDTLRVGVNKKSQLRQAVRSAPCGIIFSP